MYFNLSHTNRHAYYGSGYIAGSGSGIVSDKGQPVRRHVWLFAWDVGADAPTLVLRTVSNKNGEYLFTHLDPNRRYFIMARRGHDKADAYAVPAFDKVRPATDLDTVQLLALSMRIHANDAA